MYSLFHIVFFSGVVKRPKTYFLVVLQLLLCSCGPRKLRRTLSAFGKIAWTLTQVGRTGKPGSEAAYRLLQMTRKSAGLLVYHLILVFTLNAVTLSSPWEAVVLGVTKLWEKSNIKGSKREIKATWHKCLLFGTSLSLLWRKVEL